MFLVLFYYKYTEYKRIIQNYARFLVCFFINTDVKANNYVIIVTISRLRNVKGFIRSNEDLNSIKDALQRLKDYAKVNRLKLSSFLIQVAEYVFILCE